MAFSSSPMFDYDMNSEFVVIQSCLRNERHNNLIQTSKNITLLDNHLTFNLGDSFDCFEALKVRMEEHCKHSNVHYWMRDTRTVAGARMKTTQHIEPRLKYYNVKYACIYGGNKFSSKGQGKRNCITLKLGCTAHVTLRANRSGERLDVVSVCNHHNHPIDPNIFSRLRQERRLHSHLKEEVLDLLRLGVAKKRIIDFVRCQSGKVLLYKDIINMTSMVKGSAKPMQQRSEMLLDTLKRCEAKHRKPSPDKHEESVAPGPESKKKRRVSPKKVQNVVKRKKKIKEEKNETDSLPMTVIKEEQPVPMPLHDLDVDYTTEPVLECGAVDREVEVHYEEESPDIIAHSNILQYLYQTECEGEPVMTILNEDHEMIALNHNDNPIAQYNLISPAHSLDNDINHCQIINFEEHHAYQDLSESQEISIPEDISHSKGTDLNNEIEFEPQEISICKDLQHINAEESSQILNNKIIIEGSNSRDHFTGNDVTHIEIENSSHILKSKEIILEETWISNDNVTYVTDEIVEISALDAIIHDPNEIERCTNCDKIKLDLDTEVNILKTEKRELLEETQRLKRERDILMQEVRSLKGKQYQMIGESSHVPLMLKTVKSKTKFYVVKI